MSEILKVYTSISDALPTHDKYWYEEEMDRLYLIRYFYE